MFCKECGKLLGSGDKFCPECGTRVTVEKPKAAPLEPMFFVERREEPAIEKKPKKVVHLDEFNWDLNGYPTENRKTEAVDFDWASVLEDKVRQASPIPAEPKPEPKEEKPEPLGHMPRTVEELLAALPDDVLEIVEEPEAETPEAEEAVEVKQPEESSEIMSEEDAEEATVEDAVETEEKEVEVKSLEQIIEDFGEGPMEEPTRLIDKAQMKADSVESFYVFSKKQAEYQNLLDQEYDKIQSSLQEKEEEEAPTPTVEEILAEAEAEAAVVEETSEEIVEAEAEEICEEAETEVVAEEICEEPEDEEEEEICEEAEAEEAEEPAAEVMPEPVALELVAIAWSMPPAGIIVEKEPEAAPKTAGKDTLMQVAKDLMAELEKLMPEGLEAECEEVSADTEEVPQEADATEAEAPAAEEIVEAETPEEKETEEKKETLTFADIFNDEDDEEDEKKGGGCLKFIAVVLMILVALELGILGIQHFAKDSEAAKFINETYGKVINLVMGNEDAQGDADAENPEEPSETTALIAAQANKNKNIKEVVENQSLVFESDKNYGYEELADTYAFKNSPWYETEEGTEVTYGDEIIATLIQYYSALPDKINDVNEKVLDYVDNTTALYEELDGMEGDETRGYAINRLEIGEMKTGQKGFYVMVSVTSADKLQPEETVQTQLVYLEADPNKKVIKIKETKNI